MRKHMSAAAAVISAVACFANGSAAATFHAGAVGTLARSPTTLVTVSGFVEGFAQDGNHIVWATESGRCGRNVVLRTLSTGRSTFLDSPKGPMCGQTMYAGEVQPWMALAGTRALWARKSVSLSHYNYSVFTAAPGDREERQIAEMSIEGGLSDEGGALRPVPMSGHGKTLVFADINTDGREPSGVYRVIGNGARRVGGTEAAFAVAVSGSRFALARSIPGGCACNSDPVWSPDGRRIAFRSGAGETDGVYTPSELVVMNADGTGLRRILGHVAMFEWAPDGDSLAAWQQEGGTSNLVVAKPDGSEARTISPGGPFAWAPDGRQLAYLASSDSGQGRVFIVAVDGGTPIDLGDASGELDWSPDSQRLAYTRRVGDETHVYVASPANRSVSDVGLGAWPSWAPDGSALAFARYDGVYVAAPDGSRTHQLVPASSALAQDAVPRWSPDGRWIAFYHQGVWIVSPQGGAPQKLADNPGESPGTEWSPDSQAIVYWDGGRFAVVDVTSGVRRFSAQISDELPRWSPDGNRLIGVATNDEVTEFDAHSGAATTLTHTVVAKPRTVVQACSAGGKLLWSFDAPPDLRGLAWSGSRFALLMPRSKTQATIEIRSASGKLLRSVNVPRPWFDQFSLSGRWVVFRAGKSVRILNAASGRTAVLAHAQNASIVGLSIDGRRVVWSESTYKRSRIRVVLLPVS